MWGRQGGAARDVRIINYINIGSSSPERGEPHKTTHSTAQSIRGTDTSEDNSGTAPCGGCFARTRNASDVFPLPPSARPQQRKMDSPGGEI